jgi:Txe/YoeB family toxin of Txe-Axe toxin-antitoxin module
VLLAAGLEFSSVLNVERQSKCLEQRKDRRMQRILTPNKSTYDIDIEKSLETIDFNVYKFNMRKKPQDKNRKLIISCFTEFGCESLGLMYCIPQIARKYPGSYKIAMGWYGREYLYRHLVDEYWELKEEHQWLREFARAFHHESKNLARLEKAAQAEGRFYPSSYLGDMLLAFRCKDCNYVWADYDGIARECYNCQSRNIIKSVFSDTTYWKRAAVKVPPPSEEYMERAKKYLKPNSVGIFARGRKCYGRNLDADFYIELIKLLEASGYNPIWLGEKQSTAPCPLPHIVDFSRMEESQDLQLTLAIIKQLEFTVQFWTASTRLAAMVDTPYILIESPEQIVGSEGQEGYRLNLTTFCDKKLVYCDYKNVAEDTKGMINLMNRVIEEVKVKNFSDVIGMVDSPERLKQQIAERWPKVIGDGDGRIHDT